MNLFTEGGHFQGAVGMGEPVKIDAERPGPKLGNESRGVKILIFEHAQGQIDNAHVDPIPLQMLNNGGEAHRVHLENGCGRNEVADGSEKNGKFAEVVDRRSVQQD